MKPEKARAIRLRRVGKSYNEIVKVLGIPKSTLASWLKLYARERSAGTRALVARNKRQTVLAHARAQVVQEAASKDIRLLSFEDLRLVGAALYWAEGTKRPPAHGGRCVQFSNAEPAVITLMMRFFKEICHVPGDRFKAHVFLAPGLSGPKAVRFWSSITGIPRERLALYRTLSRASQRKRPRSRLPHGTLQLRIGSSTALFHRIMGWIGGIQRSCEPGMSNGSDGPLHFLATLA